MESDLADYNTKNAGIEPFTILYFSSVEPFSTGTNITAKGNSKAGRIRRVSWKFREN